MGGDLGGKYRPFKEEIDGKVNIMPASKMEKEMQSYSDGQNLEISSRAQWNLCPPAVIRIIVKICQYGVR